MPGKEAKDHPAVQDQHQQTYAEAFKASAVPGLGNQITPQAEHPAAGTNVVGVPAEAPNKQSADRDYQQADGHVATHSVDQNQC